MFDSTESISDFGISPAFSALFNAATNGIILYPSPFCFVYLPSLFTGIDALLVTSFLGCPRPLFFW